MLRSTQTTRDKSLEQIQALVNWKDENDVGSHDYYRIDSIAGDLAVLVIRRREWLAANPEFEKWCFTVLHDLKPVIPEDYSPAVRTGS